MLQLDRVNFAFAKAKTLQNISFKLNQGTIAAIMGESGCGKSTLLNLIYGQLQQLDGSVLWEDMPLLGAAHHLVPGHPMMKYVPQEFNLMPYTTVFENVGENISIQIDDRQLRIMKLLEVVEMEAFHDRKVKTLSGGQKQRVAIAKALVQEPQLLLLDEPFSHIDNFRKNTLRRKLFHYLQENRISVLIATHDRDDVLSFTDETIVMKRGVIVDHRRTIDLYSNPTKVYTAALFDDVNMIPVRFFANSEELLLYPHQLAIAAVGKAAVVLTSYFKGSYFLLQCDCEDTKLWVASSKDYAVNTSVFISLV